MNACKIVLYMAKALLSQEVILKKKTTKNKKEKKTKTKKPYGSGYYLYGVTLLCVFIWIFKIASFHKGRINK